MCNSILLPQNTIDALNNAAINLKASSNDKYEIILTPGYIK